jgi:hypothetical protein
VGWCRAKTRQAAAAALEVSIARQHNFSRCPPSGCRLRLETLKRSHRLGGKGAAINEEKHAAGNSSFHEPIELITSEKVLTMPMAIAKSISRRRLVNVPAGHHCHVRHGKATSILGF